MVLLHYKKSDHNQFLYEKAGAALVAQVMAELVELNNMRIRLDLFACAVQDLATHGPLKPQQIRGLSDDKQLIDNALIIAPPQKKKWAIPRKPVGQQRYNEDKTRYRIGVIKSEHITDMMIKTSNDAKKLVSYKNVQMKELLNLKMLKEAFELLKASMAIAYPNFEGLGDWQPAKMMAEGSFDYTDINTDQIDYLDINNSTMWWAGKQLIKEKPLNFYTGKNQKTKIIVKLTKSGTGAPQREAPITEEQRIQMMSMYHKKQEELKKIESNNEDDFSNSTWANPNNLKGYLVNGGTDVKWRK